MVRRRKFFGISVTSDSGFRWRVVRAGSGLFTDEIEENATIALLGNAGGQAQPIISRLSNVSRSALIQTTSMELPLRWK